MRHRHSLRRCTRFVLLLHVAAGQIILTQSNLALAQTATSDTEKPLLKQEELEQMLAPIALYPDSLLSQIFMASTYPLEIVQADRWAKTNKDLPTDTFAAELEKQDWDPSVKSLVNFPQVLDMMSDKLSMTVKLGDAFIEQQADVMNTVQILRAKAQAAGNLQSNEQQKVIVEAAPVAAQTTVVVQQVPAPPQIIQIEPVQPTVVYVPAYNPVVVYGAWPYPAYPPYPYYPPYPAGYVASSTVWFGIGVTCGVAWGYAWGNCNWRSHSVKINYNQNININRNINRSKYQGKVNNSLPNGGNWQHNPKHRQGVPYRDDRTAQKFGGANQSKQSTQAREAYRGRTEGGQPNAGRGGATQMPANNGGGRGNEAVQDRIGNGTSNAGNGGRGTGAIQNRAGAGAQNPSGTGRGNAGTQDRSGTAAQTPAGAGRGSTGTQDRTGGTAQNRPAPSPSNRPSPGNGSDAFGGAGQSGSAARADSQRGQSSRSGGGSARPSPSRGGGGTGGSSGGSASGGRASSGGGSGGRR